MQTRSSLRSHLVLRCFLHINCFFEQQFKYAAVSITSGVVIQIITLFYMPLPKNTCLIVNINIKQQNNFKKFPTYRRTCICTTIIVCLSFIVIIIYNEAQMCKTMRSKWVLLVYKYVSNEFSVKVEYVACRLVDFGKSIHGSEWLKHP